MPELKRDSQRKSNVRLGRGLGSLLSPQALETHEPVEPVPTTKLSKASQPVPPPSTAAADLGVRPKLNAESAEVKEENRVWKIDIGKIAPHKDQPRKDFAPGLILVGSNLSDVDS